MKKSNDSRVKNSIMNSIYGIGSYFIIYFITFFSRRVFGLALGKEFFGLNSLFNDIVSLLTVTELGLSTAIIFFLYKPMAEYDHEKVNAYLNFSKKLYRIIGLIILALGSFICLFLDKIAKTTIDINSARFYFMLFLMSTLVTYMYAYKKSILYADQKNRIISSAHTICKVIFELIQMALIFWTKNYVIYLVLLIISNFSENLFCSLYVDKLYSEYLRDKKVKIDKAEESGIFYKFRNLLVQNISAYIVTTTDNIVISSFLSVVTAGIYSNYILLTNTLKTIFSQVFSAFTTSFGNLSVTSSSEKCQSVFEKAQFFAFCFSAITGIVYVCVIQPFIYMWMGKEFLFGVDVPFVLIYSYFVINMNVPAISVQNALGLHQHDKYVVVVQALFNIVFSITFVQLIGVKGVILATILSTLLFPTISKPYVIYKYVFHTSVSSYIFEYLKYNLLYVVLLLGTFYVTSFIQLENIFVTFLLKGIVSLCIPLIIIILLYKKDERFLYYWNLFLKIFKRK